VDLVNDTRNAVKSLLGGDAMRSQSPGQTDAAGSEGTRAVDTGGDDAMTAAHQQQRSLLRDTLRFAVPLQMVELLSQPQATLIDLAQEAAQIIAVHGDDLQFGGAHCAAAFSALARGLAISALLSEGGVDFDGQHWCTDPTCKAAGRLQHATTAATRDDTASR
jgi:hypothetical protein